jgi:phosphatidylglycerophosphate synthase
MNNSDASTENDRLALAPVTVIAHRLQPRPAYTQALHLLDAAQKPGHGVPAYTRWVNRRVARFVAAAAANRGISANGVTIVSALFSAAAIGCLAFAPASAWLGIGIAVLLAIGYVLDSADGQVARLTGSSSPAGEWLDHVVDCVRVPAIHLAVLVGIWQAGVLPLWTAWLPLAYTLTSAGHFMSQILAEQLLKGRVNNSQAAPGTFRSWLLLPTDMGTLCWVFVLWGHPQLFIAAYGALFLLQFIVVMASVRRKYRALSSPILKRQP